MMFIRVIARSILLLLLLWFTGYGIFVANILNKTQNQQEINAQAIIVLTGGNDRITTGLKLFSQKHAPKIFITGVNEAVTDNDIKALWKKGTLPCCIELGHKAKTTRENALESKEWIESNNVKSVTLVTSDYHIDRAVQEFRHAVPNVKIHPYPVKETKHKINHQQFWKLSFSEYNKLIFRAVILTLEQKR